MVALLTVPPMPPRSSASGIHAAMTPVAPPPRTTSGVFSATTPTVPPRTTSGVFSALTPPALPPRSSSGIFAATHAPAHSHQKAERPTGLFPEPPSVPGPEEISESEIEEITDGEGPEEVGANEIEEVADNDEASSASQGDENLAMASEESVMTVDTDPSPPPSAIDPWLAQLVHGYCPPESGLFERHTPPTTMPGRDT